jgi:hypothetical protein
VDPNASRNRYATALLERRWTGRFSVGRTSTALSALLVCLAVLSPHRFALAARGNDCDDAESSVSPGRSEVVGNLRDDDCDSLADEDANGNPSGNTIDTDGDGQSPAGGDCDDTRATTRFAGNELASNRRDDDCDGLTDEATDGVPTPDRQDLDGDGFDIGPVVFADGLE